MKTIILTCLILAAVLAVQQVSQIPISPDDPDHQQQQRFDQFIQRQIDQTKRMYDQILNYKHSQDFSFVLTAQKPLDFVFAVDVDQDMEAVMTSHTEIDGAFILANKTDGQQISVQVYENRSRLLGTWKFYHTRAMLFHAKKQNEYTMRVSTGGHNKLIVMNVQHFTYKGSTAGIAKTQSARNHEMQLQGLKQKLVSFMRIAQNNQVINEWIAQNVKLHMTRYMVFQVLQGLVIFVFAIAQGYFIRKLLNKGYSIV